MRNDLRSQCLLLTELSFISRNFQPWRLSTFSSETAEVVLSGICFLDRNNPSPHCAQHILTFSFCKFMKYLFLDFILYCIDRYERYMLFKKIGNWLNNQKISFLSQRHPPGGEVVIYFVGELELDILISVCKRIQVTFLKISSSSRKIFIRGGKGGGGGAK